MSTLRSKELLALGRALRSTDAADAAGRCLASVLELAASAEARGLEVELLRWQVRGDPEFADHWAVRLDAGYVIDPTRVQVDRRRRLVSAIDDYPGNYRGPRGYPASLLLPVQRRLAASAHVGRRIPDRLLLACALRLFGHDVRRAVAEVRPLAGVGALLELLRFLGGFVPRALRRRLEARAVRLACRLDAIADPWGDTVPLPADARR